MGMEIQSEVFNRGDRVQQLGLLGLAPLYGFPYVVEIDDKGELVLSRDSPNGPPITGLHGEVRHYPPRVFRKVTWQVAA